MATRNDKKSTAAREARKHLALLDETPTTPYEVVVAWAPGQGRPITVLSIKVNGKRVALNVDDDESPARFPMPPPAPDGSYTIRWAIGAQVKIAQMVLGVVNLERGTKVKVDGKSDLNRGDIWENNEGVTIHAP